jgi:hypothetical protein
MWQDGLALLIVVIAALALLRIYAPVGWFRFGVRRKDDGSAAASAAPTGCSGCGLGASCAKTLIQARSSVIQQGEQLPAKHL